MIIKVTRRPKYLKVDLSDNYMLNGHIRDRLNRFNIRIGKLDGKEDNTLESYLEGQVSLFINSNKEVPQELEELLLREKLKEPHKKQKKFNINEYNFFKRT